MTLVELLVAMAIISILAALLVGVAATAGATAREARTKSLVARLHTLLADLPNEIWIRCNRPQQLAHHLVSEETVESVRFAEEGRLLIVSTRSPLTIFERLPQWLNHSGIHVSELRSAEESLQNLFTSLMRIHRGEL